jgi:hypothetical protein
MQAHKKTHMSRIARRWPAVVARSTPIAAAAAVLAAGLGLSAPAWSQATLQDVMKNRGLSQQDLLAAAKTYVPTGKRDEFVTFSARAASRGRSSSTACRRCAS